jgi:IstB-like ATP binding protein
LGAQRRPLATPQQARLDAAVTTIFPNATCATALIDHTVHHADVIAIEGDSYRRREAEADKKTRRPKKAA